MIELTPSLLPASTEIAEANADQREEIYRARHEVYAVELVLRAELASGLRGIGWDVTPGCANFLLVHPPNPGATAQQILAHARNRGLHLRDATNMGTAISADALGIAVKDAPTNRQMIAILTEPVTAAGLTNT